MKITVRVNEGKIYYSDISIPCALGKGGGIPATIKKEGDGATPLGIWPLRLAYFRPDKINMPQTAGLQTIPLKENDGWCDEVGCPDYNTHILLPHAGSHEALWRADNVYDIIVPLGYNDAPVFHGKGSAIFFHIARENYSPTAGCVAVALPDMLEILKMCDENSTMEILP